MGEILISGVIIGCHLIGGGGGGDFISADGFFFKGGP